MFANLKRYPQAGGNIVVYAHSDDECADILRMFRAQARGSYQRECAAGGRRWSGADLRGHAARYAGRYARSRAGLLYRATLAGLAVVEYKDRTLHGLCRVAIGRWN